MTETTTTASDGGPAFPALDNANDGHGLRLREFGMSLRDYFAAKAMAALLSPGFCSAIGKERSPEQSRVACLSQAAYEVADAMLAQRVLP